MAHLRQQDCPDEPGPVPLVIVLLKLGQVEDKLGDELSLCGFGEIHLHSQVDNLQHHWHCSALIISITTSSFSMNVSSSCLAPTTSQTNTNE